MARVPKKDWGPEFRKKKADQQHDFETPDGTEYIVYVPNFRQYEAYNKSLKEYKDVFDQIKADVKDNTTIAKSPDGFPKDFDHVEWAEILSSTLKKLNKTWGVKDKIWIYNKKSDETKTTPLYIAITPKVTQRNARRGPRKVSASAAAGSEFIVDPKNVTFGPSLHPITQYAYVVTKNDGLTYYYHTETDVNEDKHYMIKNATGEHVDENGEMFDPDEDFRGYVQEGKKDKSPAPPRAKSAYQSDDESEHESDHDYQYESDSERNNYDYNDGIPPYEGAMWDDEEGNYRILPKDIIVEPEPAPMSAPLPADQDPKESRKKKLMERRRRMALAGNAERERNIAPMPMPMPMPPPLPTPPTEDPRIVEARIGLPSPWQAYISTTYDRVYYYNPDTGEKPWVKPTMGGKRRKGKTTRKRSRSKTRSKTNQRKRGTHRRKRTTRRRV